MSRNWSLAGGASPLLLLKDGAVVEAGPGDLGRNVSGTGLV